MRSASILFLSLLFAVCAADEAPAGVGGDCKPAAIERWAQVSYIHDGDTLWLDNGAKVRIIGLNAPELARKSRPGEPLAGRARDALRRRVTGRVGLEYDEERKDRYGRVLAHVYILNRASTSPHNSSPKGLRTR